METLFKHEDGRWTDFRKILGNSKDKEKAISEIRKIIISYHVDGFVGTSEFEKIVQIYQEYLQEEKDFDNYRENPENFVKDFVKHFPLFGLTEAFKKFKTKTQVEEYEEKAVVAFADIFTTSTLNEAVIKSKCQDQRLQQKCDPPSSDIDNDAFEKALAEAEFRKSPTWVKQIVEKCNIHNHTETCRKYGDSCRFDFAQFPIWETLLTRPFVKFGEDEENLWNIL